MQTDIGHFSKKTKSNGLLDFVSVKSYMTYCLPRFLDQNRKREDKIRILDTEKVSWNRTSNLHLDKTCFTVEKSEEDKVIKQWAEGGRGWGVTTNTKKPQLILIYWYSWLSCYGRIYWLLYDLWISTIWNIFLMAGTLLRWQRDAGGMCGWEKALWCLPSGDQDMRYNWKHFYNRIWGIQLPLYMDHYKDTYGWSNSTISM